MDIRQYLLERDRLPLDEAFALLSQSDRLVRRREAAEDRETPARTIRAARRMMES
jgi:hypothetical protein